MSRFIAENHRYYGQFDPPVDRFLHERYFRRAEPGKLFIECGAFDGITESSGFFFEESLGWRAVNLEASPKIYAALQQNRPNSLNLNVALSNFVGTHEFSDVLHPMYDLCTNGSLLHSDLHRAILNESGCRFEAVDVPTTTFDKLVVDLELTEIELMVLDVEGHELEVLERFPYATQLPRILCIEHGRFSIVGLMDILAPLGYKFDTISHANAFFVHCGSPPPLRVPAVREAA